MPMSILLLLLQFDPLPIEGSNYNAQITGFELPPQDPAYFEDYTVFCDIRITHNIGFDTQYSALDCPINMVEPAIEASKKWIFEFPNDATGKSDFKIRFIARYESKISLMTLHSQIDPGYKAAFEGFTGVPGLKLVHPAEILRSKPGKAKKEAPYKCQVNLTVDYDGKPINIKPDCMQIKAVQKALKKWKFSPRVVDGITEQEELTVEISFL